MLGKSLVLKDATDNAFSLAIIVAGLLTVLSFFPTCSRALIMVLLEVCMYIFLPAEKISDAI